MYRSAFWRKRAFVLVMIGCIQFVVLTVVAMLFYPGGTARDLAAPGYSFFENFFSDLGLTVAHSGAANTISAILFVAALTLTGAGLSLFSIAFAQFFGQSLPTRILSRIGLAVGVVSGLCFVGIAWTPADLYLEAHARFVLWAFGTFPIAVIFYIAAIFCERQYPNRYAMVFIVFAVLLVLYFFLMIEGPATSSLGGLRVQATGQKLIVYASIISVLIQSMNARRVIEAAEA